MDTLQSTGALIPARGVWERYKVSDRTLDRWLERAELGFPKPIVINKRRYWYEHALAAWERSCASKKEAA